MNQGMDKIAFLPLNLQFFAEGGENGVNGNESGGETPAGQDASDGETIPADLNALLKGSKGLQSQFDKQVAKALETAKGKWEKQQGMTAEELAAEKVKEREGALSAREKELERRERKASALELLGRKGLPASLIDCVALEDDDAMKRTVEQAESAFRKSVEDAVKEQMKGKPPKDGGGGDGYAAKMRAAMGLK